MAPSLPGRPHGEPRSGEGEPAPRAT